MTFKYLINEMMLQGWRAYYIPNISSLNNEAKLQGLAVRNLIEIQIYEGKDILFVKTIHPPIEKEKTDD